MHIQIEELDMSSFLEQLCNWEGLVHGKVAEVLPADASEPLEKLSISISNYHANLHHNSSTGHSVSRTLNSMNKTPID